ncbi:MAG TPA: amidohydrolase family protein [Candidatus Copromonas faecavium]|uniref:Amidohydrolase family protein n=1 Tax=Candidatus Copromonas faecavium (nom. illeg.) TaxID=2840740 RepID=A0A9D1D547_9FIRM|nr:amidohydrolase family protein [Candidatus Copromonas faecavium]
MTTVFTNANILDVIGETTIKGGSVLVEDDIIKEVGTDIAIPEGAKVVDLGGKTMLPGIFNCHVHMCSDAGNGQKEHLSDAASAIRGIKNLRILVNSGVTYIRDAGSPNYIDIDLHEAQLRGDIIAPEMQTAGRCICMTGGHGHDSGREADGPDDCRKAAREQLKAGASWIKVMATGGVMTKGVEPGSPQLTEEELRAAIEEAHKAGAKSFTHAQGMEGIKNALRAGVDSIEHGFFMDDWCFNFMKEHNVFFVPTLAAPYWIKVHGTAAGIPDYMVRKVENTIEAHQDTFRRAHKAGVKIALGTDAGTPFNKYDLTCYECVLMVENGMTPMEAIQCGTINAAKLLSVDATHGSITPGKRANFSIFEEDPLNDIHALLNCAMTVIGGKVVFEK